MQRLRRRRYWWMHGNVDRDDERRCRQTPPFQFPIHAFPLKPLIGLLDQAAELGLPATAVIVLVAALEGFAL
jgi:hypothetical protein